MVQCLGDEWVKTAQNSMALQVGRNDELEKKPKMVDRTCVEIVT